MCPVYFTHNNVWSNARDRMNALLPVLLKVPDLHAVNSLCQPQQQHDMVAEDAEMALGPDSC